MELKEMFIDDNEMESGIEAISVVDQPAIELDFIALNKQTEIKLVGVDKKKRILLGAILVPNKPIYRNQDGKEFYIYFSKDTVRKGMELFFKKGFQNNATEQHEKRLMGCTLVESWIKEDNVHDKSVKYGLEAPIGTWLGSMKVDDDQTYEKALKGEIKGFSIEGYFTDKLILEKESLNENKTDDNDKRLLTMKGLFKSLMEKITKKTELEAVKSADGTVVFESDSFAVGEAVVFVSDEERIPVPVGTYELENGYVLVVEEEGVVASYAMPGEEAPAEAPAQETEMEEETTAKKIVESVVKETHFNKDEVIHVEFLDAHKEAIKELFTEWYAELNKEEEVEEVEVKAEKVQPIKHSPEKLAKQRTPQKDISKMTFDERRKYFIYNN